MEERPDPEGQQLILGIWLDGIWPTMRGNGEPQPLKPQTPRPNKQRGEHKSPVQPSHPKRHKRRRHHSDDLTMDTD